MSLRDSLSPISPFSSPFGGKGLKNSLGRRLKEGRGRKHCMSLAGRKRNCGIFMINLLLIIMAVALRVRLKNLERTILV